MNIYNSIISHYWPIAIILIAEVILSVIFLFIKQIHGIDPFAERLLIRIFSANFILIAIGILGATTLSIVNYFAFLK